MFVVLGLYLVNYVFHATFQALALSVVSNYAKKWSTYMMTLIPITHGFIVVLKTFVVFMEWSNATEVNYLI